ncbi:MAG: D-alanyl-D-alanine carboxypeptidase [Clostridia bacterium]|nr:D-alanyl-D-alanine carboxypeptidase [Clostridia bacterium]
MLVLVFLICFASLGLFAGAEDAGEAMPVSVNAKAAILVDVSTGRVLCAQNEHERYSPASMTKIMPLLLITEAIDEGKIHLDDKVTASATAAAKGGSQIWLKEGETMTVDELLRAAAISSANDACEALGEFLAGSEEALVKMLNDRAAQLGMNDTNFENCTGLDDTTDTHLTSAYDVALMSVELLRHDFIQKYTTVWMDSLRDGKTELVNTTKLVRFYDGCTGLKTGTTNKAGCCVSASAKRGDTHLLAVVMGSPSSKDRFEGAKALLNWGFANYETVTPQFDKSVLKPVPVNGGVADEIMPNVPTIEPVLLKKGEKDDLKIAVALSDSVQAPVEAGQKIGELSVCSGDEVLATYPLTASRPVERLSFGEVLRRFLCSFSQTGEKQG